MGNTYLSGLVTPDPNLGPGSTVETGLNSILDPDPQI